ncbi:hypothetical protein AMIS_7940 [Actinoplanes missouriensis 431]|uniref:Uncharacterized protein n=1 Tax=Actinoplanes missouriensis (strain ATCC 14538 / DSM 43046 / CBS 188.64 / JCM 3121 / NBRC 102363 / NCIMB 12654 / NRRL B-3342 / UNCC 431) TaxID=512565 RepID=I0GZ27_ACTM4|nr:tetratricopeptide repeat protein [Actinoplanes missouriensis]BAL86014.1 hypothetical protein AMIS_7940 [Actinoplanes missouriensis 431]
MTLVQVLADELSVHMSCDFRLTNPYTRQTVDDSAHKLVSIQGAGWQGLVGVTGVSVIDAMPVGEWMARTVGGFRSDLTFQEALSRLITAETSIAKILDPRAKWHTFVVGAVIGSQSTIAFVSNYQSVNDIPGSPLPSAPSDHFSVSIAKPKKARLFLAGAVHSVSKLEQEGLEAALRSGLPEAKIKERLRDVNIAASRRNAIQEQAKYRYGSGTVSEGCYVASIDATGRGTSRPFLTDQQKGDFITPEMAQILGQAGLSIRPAIDTDGRHKPVRLIQSASGSYNPSANYFREQFKLQPANSELWNNYGAWLNSKGMTPQAKEAFRRAIELDPRNTTALANLAKRFWFDDGDWLAAKEMYETALRASEPDVPSWILSDFADLLSQDGASIGRADALHQRASLDIGNPVTIARRAHFIAEHGASVERAIEMIEQAIAKQPNNFQIWFIAAKIDQYFAKDFPAARYKLEKALELAPDDVDVLLQYANLLLIQHEPETAVHFYRRAVKRGIDLKLLRGNYGLALLCARKPKPAWHQLKRAMQLLPDAVDVKINASAAMYVLGYDGAHKILERVLLESPSNELELEASAILLAAEINGSGVDMLRARMVTLIESGVTADDLAVRAVAQSLPAPERRAYALTVADVIAGISPATALTPS